MDEFYFDLKSNAGFQIVTWHLRSSTTGMKSIVFTEDEKKFFVDPMARMDDYHVKSWIQITEDLDNQPYLTNII